MKKLVSVVTPTYNEAENIALLIQEISELLSSYSEKYDYEILIIDDQSRDKTFERALDYQKQNLNRILYFT